MLQGYKYYTKNKTLQQILLKIGCKYGLYKTISASIEKNNTVGVVIGAFNRKDKRVGLFSADSNIDKQNNVWVPVNLFQFIKKIKEST